MLPAIENVTSGQPEHHLSGAACGEEHNDYAMENVLDALR